MLVGPNLGPATETFWYSRSRNRKNRSGSEAGIVLEDVILCIVYQNFFTESCKIVRLFHSFL
jgi:hypothetical protein